MSGDIFGGGSTAEKMEMLSKPQERLRNQLIQQIGGEIGKGVEGYGGQIVPGAGDIQQDAFSMIQDMLGGGGMAGQSQDVLQQILGGYDPAAAKDYWKETVYDPGKMRLMEDIMPGIMEKYAGAGASESGAARRAMAGAGQRFETDAQGQLAELLYKGQESDLERKLRGVQEVGQMQRTMADIGLTGGEQQRGIAGEQMGADYAEWQRQQAYNNPWLQYYGQTASPTSQMYEQEKEKSFLGNMMEVGKMGAGMVGSMAGTAGIFSDRRLKENIKYI
jgi:hypothetical protein